MQTHNLFLSIKIFPEQIREMPWYKHSKVRVITNLQIAQEAFMAKIQLYNLTDTEVVKIWVISFDDDQWWLDRKSNLFHLLAHFINVNPLHTEQEEISASLENLHS